MKRKITVKLEADLVHEVRILAAEAGTSTNVLLTACLEKIVSEPTAYQRARKRALARLRRGFDLQWRRPNSRDKLYDRLTSDD